MFCRLAPGKFLLDLHEASNNDPALTADRLRVNNTGQGLFIRGLSYSLRGPHFPSSIYLAEVRLWSRAVRNFTPTPSCPSHFNIRG